MNRANARKLIDNVDSSGGVKPWAGWYASLNGDGSGGVDVVSDCSGQTVAYFVQPPAGRIFRIARLLGHIREGSAVAAEEYGSMTELANGVHIEAWYDSGATIAQLTAGVPAKCNADWAGICYDMDDSSFGTGDNFVNFRWTFTKGGAVIRLKDTDSIRVIANDDFTGLVHHRFFFQGVEEK